MSNKNLTKNQLRRQRLQKNKISNNENFDKPTDISMDNVELNVDLDYDSKLNEIKTEIDNLENNNIKIPKTGKNGQLELSYVPDVITKISNLKKQAQELKKNKYQNVKKNIANTENEMFTTALKEMQDIKSRMHEFSASMSTQTSEITDDTKEMVNTEFTGFNKAQKRRNSTSSTTSSTTSANSTTSNTTTNTSSTTNTSINSYESSNRTNQTNQTNHTNQTNQTNNNSNKFSNKMPSEKELLEAANKMWDAVKIYVKQNPKFRELQDKQKLEVFRDKLGFSKFMEEFPIVSRYMVCMGQFKLKAFQRLLDKMKRTKYPPPEERDKKYMEDQWIRWQADYVQYLWEEYQKRHYNTAEKQWVWQETYKRLKGEFDDFRKMHEDIEEKVKQEKKTLSGKNARDLLERLKTGSQKLKPEDEEQLLQSLLDISYKKNYKTTMQELLKNVESTEDKYENQNKVFNILMPCCGRLVNRDTLEPLFNNIVFAQPVAPLAYVAYNGEITAPHLKCPACSANIRNVDIKMYNPYMSVFRGLGRGDNNDKQPKVSMIETVDVGRMSEIHDSYKSKELRGMEPILEDVSAEINAATEIEYNETADDPPVYVEESKE